MNEETTAADQTQTSFWQINPPAPPKDKTGPRPRKSSKANFYARALDEAESLDFESAAGKEGLDDEITLLRLKIRSLVEKEPDNLRLYMEATNMLARMVKTRYSMTKDQKKGLAEAIRNVIKDIGVPLGVSLINKKL